MAEAAYVQPRNGNGNGGRLWDYILKGVIAVSLGAVATNTIQLNSTLGELKLEVAELKVRVNLTDTYTNNKVKNLEARLNNEIYPRLRNLEIKR